MKNYGKIVFSNYGDLEQDNDHKPLVVTNCGYYVAHNTPSTFKWEPNPNEWLLLYLRKGRIRLKMQHDAIVQQGSILIFPPTNLLYYQFLDDETSERYYVYFKGTQVENYLNQFLLNEDSGVYYIGDSPTLISYFMDIMNDFKVHDFYNDVFRSLTLLKLFNHIYNKNPLLLQRKEELLTLQVVIDYMEKNYSDKLSLDKLSTIAKMSLPTFTRYFKKQTGTSPNIYLNNIRLTQAKYLLMSSDFPIGDIALQVGFTDQLYFCKFFKKQTGYTPTDFRNKFNSH